MNPSTAASLTLCLLLTTAGAASGQVSTRNLYPEDGELDVSVRPTLEIDCSAAGIVAARYVLSADPDFASIVYDSGENRNDVCSHVAPANLASLATYHWRARVKHASGAWSEWSSPTAFTTIDATLLHNNVFQDGVFAYAGTADADIRGSYEDPSQAVREWNQGAQDVMRTGRRPPGSPTDEIYRSLVRFDLRELNDPNAVVSAFLALTGWQHNFNDFFTASHSMYEIRRPWDEGNGTTNTPPQPGEVSWTHSAFPERWSSPGASHASDADPVRDRDATPLARLVAENRVGHRTTWSSRALIDAVRRWIADPSSNHGLVIVADDESMPLEMNFATSEHADPFFRPRLVVVSTEPTSRPANRPPVAQNDVVMTRIGVPVRIPVLANDRDLDVGPGPLRIVSIGAPAMGTAVPQMGEILYTPGPEFFGPDTFTYEVSDGAASASATVTVSDALACSRGTVGAGSGPILDVLRINDSAGGEERVVRAALGEPVAVTLEASQAGPSPAPYLLFVWLRPPTNPVNIVVGRSFLGCTVNPTPLQAPAAPSPYRCLRSPQIPMAGCAGVLELPAPPSAPWTATRSTGVGRQVTFTLQGILRDDGSASTKGFSVTNAVSLVVE